MKEQQKKEQILDSLPYREYVVQGEPLWNDKSVYLAMELFGQYKIQEQEKNNNILSYISVALVIGCIIAGFWVTGLKQDNRTINTINDRNYNIAKNAIQVLKEYNKQKLLLNDVTYFIGLSDEEQKQHTNKTKKQRAFNFNINDTLSFGTLSTN